MRWEKMDKAHFSATFGVQLKMKMAEKGEVRKKFKIIYRRDERRWRSFCLLLMPTRSGLYIGPLQMGNEEMVPSYYIYTVSILPSHLTCTALNEYHAYHIIIMFLSIYLCFCYIQYFFFLICYVYIYLFYYF